MWIPIFGWGLAALKPIAIDRRAGHTAVTQVIEQGRRKLEQGVWVTIFPEGTRVLPGTVRKYGVSGAALAREAGCRVLPVAHNAGDFWPRRSLTKRPGLVRFCIGPPIETAARSPKQINEAVRQWIEAKMAEISATPSP
jgi:1-acyl-sn-glycerol-3-phosphate acyltransferase